MGCCVPSEKRIIPRKMYKKVKQYDSYSMHLLIAGYCHEYHQTPEAIEKVILEYYEPCDKWSHYFASPGTTIGSDFSTISCKKDSFTYVGAYGQSVVCCKEFKWTIKVLSYCRNTLIPGAYIGIIKNRSDCLYPSSSCFLQKGYFKFFFWESCRGEILDTITIHLDIKNKTVRFKRNNEVYGLGILNIEENVGYRAAIFTYDGFMQLAFL